MIIRRGRMVQLQNPVPWMADLKRQHSHHGHRHGGQRRAPPFRVRQLEQRPQSEHRHVHQRLRLNQHAQRSQPPGEFEFAVERQRRAQHDHHRQRGIALAPHDRVEAERRIERHQQHRDVGGRAPRGRGAPHENKHQQGEHEVRDQRRGLDDHPEHHAARAGRVRDNSREPQRVEIAGRIVEEVAGAIDARGALGSHLQRPRFVADDVVVVAVEPRQQRES